MPSKKQSLRDKDQILIAELKTKNEAAGRFSYSLNSLPRT